MGYGQLDKLDEVPAGTTNTGKFFLTQEDKTSAAAIYGFPAWGPFLAGDFNGNGYSDTAAFDPSNGTWWVSLSTGSSFSTGLWDDFGTNSGWTSQVVGDFNGDG
ncbi:VCBS repeat-containing protein, partial [Archangium sp.]|uniref:FG-GAP repeat domain-containing protein n=1 Tax=Archangium sp. TaxID=1872627 RepID=UPI002D303FA0